MKTYWLKFCLESDATLGRGDGVAGVVDAEVQHDANGLPYLGGKTLKGLLSAECAEIMFALSQATPDQAATWEARASRLFGSPGSNRKEVGNLHVGDAQLPKDLRTAIAYDVRRKSLTRENVLESITAVRRQTAMDAESGAPQKESLRAMRVVLRETPFESRLDFAIDPQPEDLALLAACVKAFRRAGAGRNRGRGRLVAEMYDAYPGVDKESGEPIASTTDVHFEVFRKAVQ